MIQTIKNKNIVGALFGILFGFIIILMGLLVNGMYDKGLMIDIMFSVLSPIIVLCYYLKFLNAPFSYLSIFTFLIIYCGIIGFIFAKILQLSFKKRSVIIKNILIFGFIILISFLHWFTLPIAVDIAMNKIEWQQISNR